ncbi:hypothetical protein KUTeg_003937 [Tegillarca granosa]|uniref:Uncharacterized protein n=1 Tax=Tegillarca granosa TaxID=220873 RepID=A0ABQ9FNI8_TEGGR|nr:hypothetical protein KUTeg_003937 [Tegillarca granosa]
MDVQNSDNNTQEMKNIKSQYEDEFLVKVGAKKEEITKYGPRRVFFYNRHVSNVLTGLGIEEDNK